MIYIYSVCMFFDCLESELFEVLVYKSTSETKNRNWSNRWCHKNNSKHYIKKLVMWKCIDKGKGNEQYNC